MLNVFNKQTYLENPSKKYASNNYGEFTVLDYLSSTRVRIVFFDTGFIMEASSGSIRKGSVKDLLKPSIYGVGYIGSGKYKDTTSKAYSLWINMIRRCYDSNNPDQNPTYAECFVCEDWHNFQNFADWFYNTSNYATGLHLDKDIIKENNKLYCPEYCKFVSQDDNTVKSHAKHYTFFNPEGVLTEIYNLRSFCRTACLDYNAIIRVSSGRQGHHRKWTKA